MAEALATRVKQIQRTDSVGKSAWWNFANTIGAGVRDPAKHEAHVLQSFLSQYDKGAFAGVEAAYSDSGHLGELFKEGQRNAPSFKTAWATYNLMNGSTKNDPSKANKDVLVGFLEFLGQQGVSSMCGGKGGGWCGKGGGWAGCSCGGKGSGGKGSGGKGSGGSWGGPPVKKQKVSTGDVWKDELVEKIKQFQRSGEEQKQAWWSFCDASDCGNRDPARHEVDVLQGFIQGCGL